MGPGSYVPVSILTPQTPDQTVPYNANNQWLGATHDAAGNLTAQPERTYSYDGENRVVTATGPQGAVTYRYDGEGRRVKRESGLATTVYVEFGRRCDGSRRTDGKPAAVAGAGRECGWGRNEPGAVDP